MQFLFPIDHSPFHFVHLFLQIPDIAAYTKNAVNIERADQTCEPEQQQSLYLEDSLGLWPDHQLGRHQQTEKKTTE